MKHHRSESDLNIYRKNPMLRRILTWIDRYRAGTLGADVLANNLYSAEGVSDGETTREIRDALRAAAFGMEGARFGVEIEFADSARTELRSIMVTYLDQ